MPVENITLSQRGRDQLVTLKRRTGIANWNTLCRWAFCRSLAEPSTPPLAKHPADSNVTMNWRTFAGQHEDIYWALLRQRCDADGLPLDEETLALQFRIHLHRGIGYLVGDRGLRSISDLLGQATSPQRG
ncbi:DNA sulfur modification protein DndE [Actinokineospora spheciospongiae]|uniref:DNA sulfur modification protein DndE n=1 Tax=Actinokineospora spheciospongiae TaxID=909613 RepID=UPI000D71354B|nr:DNA sulfur modification protein DndE [Actinokineospora spheciospongiae]PWW65624.1 DNA sulfur modification protein DndE [Actinokineospora spheciospongiae]